MTVYKFKMQCNNKLLIARVIFCSLTRERKNGGEIYRIKSQFSISREYFELLIYETALLILHFGVLRHILYAAARA